MPLIDVDRIVIRELDTKTFETIENGRIYTQDCNTTIDFSPIFMGGEEKVYENENAVVLLNVETPNIYGYDVTFNTQEFSLSLLEFLSGGVYRTGLEGNQTHNILGIMKGESQGTTDVSKVMSLSYGYLVTSSQIQAVQFALNYDTAETGIDKETYPTAFDTDTTVTNISDTNKRRYVEMDLSSSNVTSALLAHRQKVIDDGILEPTSPSYTVHRAVESKTVAVSRYSNEERQYSAFRLLANISYGACIGGNEQWRNGDRMYAVRNVRYNVLFGFENALRKSNSIGSYNFCRWYQEIDSRLRPYVRLYITMNPQLREFLANEYDPSANSNNRPRAEQLYNNIQTIANNDPYALYNDNAVFVDNTFRNILYGTDNYTNYSNRTVVFRKQMEFEEEIPLMITAIAYYYIPDGVDTSTWNGNSIESMETEVFPLLPLAIPQITVADVDIDKQTYVSGLYTSIAQYDRDVEKQLGADSETDDQYDDLEIGQYKTGLGTIQQPPRLFSMDIYTKNMVGASQDGYYKIELPMCYSEPMDGTLNNTFNDYSVSVHARDNYKHSKSAVYIKHVASLDE